LNEHHLLGLFYHLFNNSNLPDECQQQYKKQWIHNSIILEEIEKINLVMAAHDIHATLLKGSHLLTEIYKDLGSRFLSDVDLLIDSNDKNIFEKILLECGYTSRKEDKFHGNHFKSDWFKIEGFVEINIELHTQLFFHLDVENWEYQNSHFSQFKKLKDEDLIIHLCGHLAFQHNFLKLYWLFDLYLILNEKKDKLNWIEIKNKSQEKNLFRSLQMCLWALTQYFGSSFDKETQELFELKNIVWWKDYLSMEFLINPLKSKTTYLVVKHATKDQLRTALYYDLTWFYHYKVQKLWSK
jgi:hypothetical protein